MFLSAVSDYASLSDADLDSAYQNTWEGMQIATGTGKIALAQNLNDIAQNIISRVGGLWGFITGSGGYTRFPLYDAVQKANPTAGGFQQSKVAQSSLATSASNVAQSATTALKWGASAAMGLGVASLVLLYIVNKKK